MSTLSQFGGGSRSTKAITNGYSAGSTSSANIGGAGGSGQVAGAKQVTSGALTANTLAQQLSVTGAGRLSMLALATVDATARTVRLQVIADGTTVFDATSNSVSAGGSGIAACGPLGATASSALGDAITFNASLVVNACSSLTETGKLVTNYLLQTY